jgi:hypothetical protein
MKPFATLEVIAPVEAFRLILCALDAEIHASCADKITSYAWFWYPKSLRISGCANLIANNALMLLRKHIKEGDIRVRGVLRPENPPTEIDSADCKDGQLHVFDQTLTIYGEGKRFYCTQISASFLCQK